VGEVRDLETAQIACQAALTGHLVLATLHTNTAVQSVTRLLDLGVKPFLVAPSVIGVLAQRLVRKICDRCKEKYSITQREIRDLFIWEGRELFLYRGKGCPQCNDSGYSGRVAIHEIILLDDNIRNLIARGESVSTIQQVARKAGFQTMRYDGIKKALRGITTLAEVNRVTVAEGEAVAGEMQECSALQPL
jgi:type IV pilus assembly protein PilB